MILDDPHLFCLAHLQPAASVVLIASVAQTVRDLAVHVAVVANVLVERTANVLIANAKKESVQRAAALLVSVYFVCVCVSA